MAQCSSSAERMRRYRKRQRDGALLLDIQINRAGIERLVTGGWLAPDQQGDHEAVAKALMALADRAMTPEL
jgi:hypothetical protein